MYICTHGVHNVEIIGATRPATFSWAPTYASTRLPAVWLIAHQYWFQASYAGSALHDMPREDYPGHPAGVDEVEIKEEVWALGVC